MSELKLTLWKSLLWQNTYAYCPEHRLKLEIVNEYNHVLSQDTQVVGGNHLRLICPEGDLRYELEDKSFWILQRRYKSAKESMALQKADIVNLDGLYTPVLVKKPDENDDKYWVEVRINETKNGKQLVIYSGVKGVSDKVQIFIDPQNDKISFDQNNLHPNEIFSRVVANFKDTRSATLDSEE